MSIDFTKAEIGLEVNAPGFGTTYGGVRMTSKILAYLIAGLITYALVVTAVDWLTLPTVATSYSTGECVWVEELGTKGRLERRTCPLVIPQRYEHVYVK